MYRMPATALLLLAVAANAAQAEGMTEGEVRRCLAVFDDMRELRHEVDDLADDLRDLVRRKRRLANTIRRLRGQHASARSEMNNARGWMQVYQGQMYNNAFARSEYQRYRDQYNRARYRVDALAREIRPKLGSYESLERRFQRVATERDELGAEMEDKGEYVEARCSGRFSEETFEAVCGNDRYESCAKVKDYRG